MALKVFRHNQVLAETILTALTDYEKTSLQYSFDNVLIEPVKKFIVSGKMFRGGLFLTVVTELMRLDNPSSETFKVATVLELVGSAILIQDDVMDEAVLRRDLPALHREYAGKIDLHQPKIINSRFGESSAILVSDFLLFLATKILSLLELKPETSLKLIEAMSTEITQLVFNQAEELRFAALPLSDLEMTQEKILQIMIGKTARYTVQWPLRFAAIVAGVAPEIDLALQNFGEAAGVVFQLSDDRLGLFGETVLTGKDIDSDARSGKKTFYAYFAQHLLKGAQAQEFSALYGKSDLSLPELAQLQELLVSSGVEKEVNLLTQTYVAKAKLALEALGDWPRLQKLLAETVDFLAVRAR